MRRPFPIDGSYLMSYEQRAAQEESAARIMDATKKILLKEARKRNLKIVFIQDEVHLDTPAAEVDVLITLVRQAQSEAIRLEVLKPRASVGPLLNWEIPKDLDK